AHVRERRRLTIHPDRHHVAADARGRAAALGNIGRCIVRTARTEVGETRQFDPRLSERGFLLIDELDASANLFDRPWMQVETFDPLRDHARDHRRRQFRVRREQPIAVRAHPFALLVELADDARAYVVAPVVELLLQLVFDDLALFLDHQDFGETLGKMAHAFRLERPWHRNLEHANTDLGGVGFGNAEIVERLPDVEIAFAAGNDPETRLRRIDGDAVQFVDAAIVQSGVRLVILHPSFGLQEAVGPANRQAIRRQRKIVGNDNLYAVRIGRYRRRAFDRVRD